MHSLYLTLLERDESSRVESDVTGIVMFFVEEISTKDTATMNDAVRVHFCCTMKNSARFCMATLRYIGTLNLHARKLQHGRMHFTLEHGTVD